jgi:cytochrome-b5 reductase
MASLLAATLSLGVVVPITWDLGMDSRYPGYELSVFPGDILHFTWSSFLPHDLHDLSAIQFSRCDVRGVVLADFTQTGSTYVSVGDAPGSKYFSCSVAFGAHCIGGQKLNVTVRSFQEEKKANAKTANVPIRPTDETLRQVAPLPHGELVLGPPSGGTSVAGSSIMPSTWTHYVVKDIYTAGANAVFITFSLPDEKSLSIPTCGYILVRSDSGKARPYTPVSAPREKGSFSILIRVYPGGVGEHLSNRRVGDRVAMRHSEVMAKIQYPFRYSSVVMVCGGAGVTPMLQALHAILGNEGDMTRVFLLYSNRQREDVLAKKVLQEWCQSSGRLDVLFTLTGTDASWDADDVSSRPSCADFQYGRVTPFRLHQDSKRWHLSPSSDTAVFISGPPGFSGISEQFVSEGHDTSNIYIF